MGKRKQADDDDTNDQHDHDEKPKKPSLILHGPKQPNPQDEEIARLKKEAEDLEALRDALRKELHPTEDDAPDSPPPEGFPPSPPGSPSPPASPAAPLPDVPPLPYATPPRQTQPAIPANFGAVGWSNAQVSQLYLFHLMSIHRSR